MLLYVSVSAICCKPHVASLIELLTRVVVHKIMAMTFVLVEL